MSTRLTILLSGMIAADLHMEAVVQSCLAKDPNQRPANAAELAELYRKALATHQVVNVGSETSAVSQAGALQPLANQDSKSSSLIAGPIIIAAGVAENALVESMVPLPQVQEVEKSTTPDEHAQIQTGVVEIEPAIVDKPDDLTLEGVVIPSLSQRSGGNRGSLPDADSL